MQYFHGLVTTLRSYMLSSIPVLGLGIGLLFLGNACDDSSTPQQICLQVDPYDCPQAVNGNASLDLRRGVADIRYAGFDPNVGSFRDETTSFPGGVPYEKVTTDIQVTGSAAMSSGQRRVEGVEINFSFLSKDSRYSWTYEEMFAWKHGRWPNAAEAAAITDEQAIQWFHERHASWSGPAYNVMTKREPETRYCFDVVSDLDYFAGDVVFPNGKKCKIEPNPTRISHAYYGSNPFVYLLKIKKPCDACY